jgi:YVTN family beta-propeller protein
MHMSAMARQFCGIASRVARGAQVFLLALCGAASAAPLAYIGHNTGNGTVRVVDVATQSVVSTIAVGGNPFGIAVNAAGTRVYVVKSTSAQLAVTTRQHNKSLPPSTSPATRAPWQSMPPAPAPTPPTSRWIPCQ